MDMFRGQSHLPGLSTLILRWIGCVAVLCLIALAVGVAQQDPSSVANREVPYLPPDAIRLPDKNAQIELGEQKTKKQNYEAVNAARKKQIAEDAARLLQLATELKAEVDKTNKDTLSLNVIRKADTIERLAKGVKEKMKLTIGGS